MTDLLSYILTAITGSKDFVIDDKTEDSRIEYKIVVPKEVIGIVIGKEGRTIKAIQDILRIKARVENKFVFVTVEEKS